MKVLLLKDVYKLGRAGDVKKVADGYGRNFLLPQGMAVLATAEALKSAERIREKANVQRAIVNQEMDTVGKQIAGLTLTFPARASETGKLYGSVTTQMIADAIKAKSGVEIARRQIDSQPLRMLGEYKVYVRLTVDLIPTIDVVVYREGEAIAAPTPPKPVASVRKEAEAEPEPVVETESEPESE
jgi:large subunit ribosomal protein L9